MEIFPNELQSKFHVVQVGRTAGAEAMKNRVYAHNLGWHFATCEHEAFSKSKVQPSDYTVATIHQFPRIIGVLACAGSGSKRFVSANAREYRVRELVGIKLDENLVVKLLTQEFESDRGGYPILTDSSRSNFSISELRLVSGVEVSRHCSLDIASDLFVAHSCWHFSWQGSDSGSNPSG